MLAMRFRVLQQRLNQRPVGLVLLLAGACLTLGFAPFFIWPAALASLVVLVLALRHAQGLRQALGAVLVWGVGWQLTSLYWLPRAFYVDADFQLQAAILGGIPALLGVALWGVLGVLAVALISHPARARPGLHALVFGLAWLVLEHLKSLSGLGFPWLPLGAIWAGWLTTAQLAHVWVLNVGGVALLTALTLAAASLLSLFTWRSAVLAGVLLLSATSYGAWRLATAPSVAALQVGQPVWRVVQPNIKSPHKWDPVQRWLYLNDTLDLAFSAPGAPPVVVLPESAVPFYLDTDAEARAAVAAKLQPGQVLLAGTVRQENPPNPGQLPRFFNTLGVVDAAGQLATFYDKHILVPFGEYIPWRNLIERLPLPFGLATVSQSRLDYTAGYAGPGTQGARLTLPDGTPVVALICYEGIFPNFVRQHAQGARALVNITNDNWFTGTTALHQHLALARLRAIETGLPLVRVANTGITEITDGYGRTALRLPANAPQVADVAIPRPVNP